MQIETKSDHFIYEGLFDKLQFATTISHKANLAYAEASQASAFKRHHLCPLKTPGHTKRSICYFFRNEIYIGDVLFKG